MSTSPNSPFACLSSGTPGPCSTTGGNINLKSPYTPRFHPISIYTSSTHNSSSIDGSPFDGNPDEYHKRRAHSASSHIRPAMKKIKTIMLSSPHSSSAITSQYVHDPSFIQQSDEGRNNKHSLHKDGVEQTTTQPSADSGMKKAASTHCRQEKTGTGVKGRNQGNQTLPIPPKRPTWRTQASPISSPTRGSSTVSSTQVPYADDEVDELCDDVSIKEEETEVLQNANVDRRSVRPTGDGNDVTPYGPIVAPLLVELNTLFDNVLGSTVSISPPPHSLDLPTSTGAITPTTSDVTKSSLTSSPSLDDRTNIVDTPFVKPVTPAVAPQARVQTISKVSSKLSCVEIPSLRRARPSKYKKFSIPSMPPDSEANQSIIENTLNLFSHAPPSSSDPNQNYHSADILGSQISIDKKDRSKTKKRESQVEQDVEHSEGPSRKRTMGDQNTVEVKVEPEEHNLSPQEMLRRGRAKKFDDYWLSDGLSSDAKRKKIQIERERCRLLVRGHLMILKKKPSSYLRECKVLVNPSLFPSKTKKTIRKLVQVIRLAGGSIIGDFNDFASPNGRTSSVHVQISSSSHTKVKGEPGTQKIYRLDLYEFLQWFDRRSLDPSPSIDTSSKNKVRPTVDPRDLVIHSAKPSKKSRGKAPRPIPSDQFYGNPAASNRVLDVNRNSRALSGSRAELRHAKRQHITRSTFTVRPSIGSSNSRSTSDIASAPTETPLDRLAKLFKRARAPRIRSEWLSVSESQSLSEAKQKGNEAVEGFYNDRRLKWYKTAFLELTEWTGETDLLRQHVVYRVKGYKIASLDENRTMSRIIKNAGGLILKNEHPTQKHRRFAMVKPNEISQEIRTLAVQEEALLKTELELCDYLFNRYLKTKSLPEQLAMMI
ncbi:uncharacterized protein L199_002066 [Kwoniella botswanensis]|uniref:uncharacterized protein n=1 Tax=Kwoniella botswanensis TaxID=1268659 RepID=UPI00315CDD21